MVNSFQLTHKSVHISYQSHYYLSINQRVIKEAQEAGGQALIDHNDISVELDLFNKNRYNSEKSFLADFNKMIDRQAKLSNARVEFPDQDSLLLFILSSTELFK